MNNPLGKWIGVIKRGAYQADSEDIRWSYEPVYDLWSDINHDSEYSDDGSTDEGSKDQDNPYDQEPEEVVSVTCIIPRRPRLGEQIALQLIRSDF